MPATIQNHPSHVDDSEELRSVGKSLEIPGVIDPVQGSVNAPKSNVTRSFLERKSRDARGITVTPPEVIILEKSDLIFLINSVLLAVNSDRLELLLLVRVVHARDIDILNKRLWVGFGIFVESICGVEETTCVFSQEHDANIPYPRNEHSVTAARMGLRHISSLLISYPSNIYASVFLTSFGKKIYGLCIGLRPRHL